MQKKVDTQRAAIQRSEESRENAAPDKAVAGSINPEDDWERKLLEAARPWGVSYSDNDLSSAELYD
jgi:hypothetical protein